MELRLFKNEMAKIKELCFVPASIHDCHSKFSLPWKCFQLKLAELTALNDNLTMKLEIGITASISKKSVSAMYDLAEINSASM